MCYYFPCSFVNLDHGECGVNQDCIFPPSKRQLGGLWDLLVMSVIMNFDPKTITHTDSGKMFRWRKLSQLHHEPPTFSPLPCIYSKLSHVWALHTVLVSQSVSQPSPAPWHSFLQCRCHYYQTYQRFKFFWKAKFTMGCQVCHYHICHLIMSFI